MIKKCKQNLYEWKMQLIKVTLANRVVRSKNFIEQEEIQRQAMIPAKEAKLYTYKLLEEHYLQAKPIRKPGGGGTGMAKCFFMFHVNQHQVSVFPYLIVFPKLSTSSVDRPDVARDLLQGAV